MGFFDIFRRKKEEVKEKEKVVFGKLDSWVNAKEKKLDGENRVYLDLVGEKVEKLLSGLKGGIKGLDEINWDKIKAEERLKLIVKENLGNYVLHLGQLALDLEGLEKINRKKLDSVFHAFDRRTAMNYQKSSILIGKELEAVRESVRIFFKDLGIVEKENKELIENLEVISVVKGKLIEYRDSKRLVDEINDLIKSYEGKIGELDKEIDGFKKEIEGVKKTDAYIEFVSKGEKLKENKVKLVKEINELRVLIDFKHLASMWHENKLEMGIVKEHRENFERAFRKDGGKGIMEIVGKSGVSDLDGLYSKISERLKEIDGVDLGDDLTLDLEGKIRKIGLEIDRIREKVVGEEKRTEKFKESGEMIVGEINDSLFTIGVDVE